jgi:hypothetical protein
MPTLPPTFASRISTSANGAAAAATTPSKKMPVWPSLLV